MIYLSTKKSIKKADTALVHRYGETGVMKQSLLYAYVHCTARVNKRKTSAFALVFINRLHPVPGFRVGFHICPYNFRWGR